MGQFGRLLTSRAWLFAIAFGVFAYSFHKVGSILGFYPRFFWFQMVAHFLSAAAMAVLLVRFGLAVRVHGTRLVVFVVAFSIVGAVGWELVEYLELRSDLIWWGIEDSLLDLSMDALGVGLVLYFLRTRFRPIIDPTQETPPVRDIVTANDAQPGSGTR